MVSKYFFKFSRSLIKIILPALTKIFIFLRVNKRVENFLNEKSHRANDYYDFSKIILDQLGSKKIIALDIGAQGGFNSDYFFPKKYNKFFDVIAVEPLKEESEILKNNHKFLIDKGLWSDKKEKELYILGNRKGSSSMYRPDKTFFDLHGIKEEDYSKFEITDKIRVNCSTIGDELNRLKIKKLDYLKIDTQGSEFEILKGIENYRPLLIRSEIQIFSLYKDVPEWNNLLNKFYDLNYIICDWKKIGSHKTRSPMETEMIFIPNFKNDEGKKLISNNKNEFISLMLIFGYIDLLKFLVTKLNMISFNDIENLNDRFFY